MSFEDFVKKIEEAKVANGTTSIELGKVLCEAKNELKSEFNSLLKDSRVKYKRTQANKLITFYEYSEKCQSTDTAIKIGIEKVCVLAKVADIEQQKRLHDFVENNEISVAQLNKVLALVKDTKDMDIPKALEMVKNAKKEIKSSENKDFEALKAENDSLKKQLKQMETRLADFEQRLSGSRKKKHSIKKNKMLANQKSLIPMIENT